MEQNTEDKIEEMLDDKKMLVGIFKNNSKADFAFLALIKMGYAAKDINIVMSESTRSNFYKAEKVETEVLDSSMEGAGAGAAVGSTIGATIGTIIGLAVAIGSNVIIPGIGLLAAGPLIAGLAGAGTGVVTGGIIGALVGVGSEETQAQLYEKYLQEGQILIGIRAKSNDENKIREAWEEIGAESITK
jgi:hypothetical protein